MAFLSFEILCVLILVVLAIVRSIWLALTSPLSKIPGPFLNRISVLPLKLHSIRGERIHYIHRLHAQYGEYVVVSPREIAISSPSTTKQIHKIGTPFLKAPFYREMTQETQSPALFSMIDPKAHATRRKMFSRAFSQNALNEWEEFLQGKTSLAVERIREAAMHGKANVLEWWSFMATDVIGEMSFGHAFGSLEGGQKTDFSRDLEGALIYAGIRYELSPFPALLKYIPVPALQYWLNCQNRLNEYGRTFLQRSKYLEKRGETRGTLFSRMIDEAAEGVALTEAQVEREASNLVVAGSDTTAVTLTYLVWILLKKPDIRRKVTEEVLKLPANFSNRDVEALPYLGCVIQEALRLFGAAPGMLPRTVPKGGANLGGYVIPESITVSTHAYTLHRNASIFEHPLEFIPERWEAPTQAMKDAFMPFGAGTRICIGLHLAKMELNLAIAKFLRQCQDAQLDASMKDSDMDFENFFLIAPKSHKCDITIPPR